MNKLSKAVLQDILDAEKRCYSKALKEITWHRFDTELQKKINEEIKRWKERGRKWSGTYWTDCIFRTIGGLIEEEGIEWKKKIEDKINKLIFDKGELNLMGEKRICCIMTLKELLSDNQVETKGEVQSARVPTNRNASRNNGNECSRPDSPSQTNPKTDDTSKSLCLERQVKAKKLSTKNGESLAHTSSQRVKTARDKCLMWKNNKCNSDYGNKIKCDGIKAPKKCPYKDGGGSFAMIISDRKNRRKVKEIIRHPSTLKNIKLYRDVIGIKSKEAQNIKEDYIDSIAGIDLREEKK